MSSFLSTILDINLRDAGIWLLIFAITVAETLISTWEGRADRQATAAKTRKYSLRAAHWALLFELVLFIDIIVIVREGWEVIFPILAGAWLGKYWAVERRRKKFRANAGRLGRKAKVSSAPAASSPEAPHTHEEAAS